MSIPSPNMSPYIPRKGSVTSIVGPPISLASSPSTSSLINDAIKNSPANITSTSNTLAPSSTPPAVASTSVALPPISSVRSTAYGTLWTPPRRTSIGGMSSTAAGMVNTKNTIGTKSFFDSPRNSFSKSYSASALRISRTTLDDSGDEGNSGAIASSESDTDDDNIQVTSNGMNEIQRNHSKAKVSFAFHPTSYEGRGATNGRVQYQFLDSDPGSPKSSSVITTSVGQGLPPNNLQNNDSSGKQQPAIFFKKSSSKRSIVPKFKAFRRIADELRVEMFPLDEELAHESMITTALKDEEEVLSGKKLATSLLTARNDPVSIQHDNLKRYEVISKANEAWNKHRAVSPSPSVSTTQSHTSTGQDKTIEISKKRKNSLDDSDASTYGGSDTETRSSNKRRLVSLGNSPILGAASMFLLPTAATHNSHSSAKLIQSASDDLEMMSMR
ncbi:hypothetical protein FOA43_003928 [Brettanomyces nanus]|uniref:Uncharacterized protein n=1 Tax=Eeniella nana TaxID=13502 RepID=A0A875SAC5_EENNA|nr:uncharacterized protein FOA43_003928 [Brettanomyces nanus]QPG76539.1 hypothetical protein FOA43_003928 [Brettanomyces nanus]